MKKIQLLALSAIVAGMAISCQNEEIANDQLPTTVSEIKQSHLAALEEAGINPENATYEVFKGLPGDPEVKMIKVDDIMIPLDELEAGDHALSTVENLAKQYRTNNLISRGNRSFRVVGYTGPRFALTNKMRTALQWAVNNYNRLNTSLNLTLVFQSDFTDRDMVVFNNGASGGGGSAGFPSGGEVFKRVQINQGTDSFTTDVVEHVITHEIGHSIGFRHQDWRTRQSCSRSQAEQEQPSGAILINGTPSSDRADSIMLACFSRDEDGEFTDTDIVAINALY